MEAPEEHKKPEEINEQSIEINKLESPQQQQDLLLKAPVTEEHPHQSPLQPPELPKDVAETTTGYVQTLPSGENEIEEEEDEKDNSTNLVIDLEDEKEEEETKKETEVIIILESKEEEDQNGPIAAANESVTKEKTREEAVIALSDGEEQEKVVTASVDVAPKAAKVQKRRSMGSAGQQTNEEEHYRLKRRKINVEGAPKMPLTGYVRYMNDRRESLRKEHPNKTAMEHTKMIGEEWQTMSAELKAPYMHAAELDKQRYVKELHIFLKSRPDVLASELAKNKSRKSLDSSINISSGANPVNATLKEKIPVQPLPQENTKSTMATKDETKDKSTNKSPLLTTVTPNTNSKTNQEQLNEKSKRQNTPTPPLSSSTPDVAQISTVAVTAPTHNTENNENVAINARSSASVAVATPTPGEIPIFTNEFLEHNKLYDTELKTLRKSKIDLEQQNAVLEKYVENMKTGLNKMANENNELQEKNRLLEVYLDKLKRKLAQALSGLPLPTVPNGASVENIEQYMKELYSMSNTNTHGPATLNKAKDIIRKLDLQIQL